MSLEEILRLAISLPFGQVDVNKKFLPQSSAVVYSEATGQMTRTDPSDGSYTSSYTVSQDHGC